MTQHPNPKALAAEQGRRAQHRLRLIEPGTPEWLRTITPSKVAAILGVSRWQSPFALWHEMKGLIDPQPHKDIFDTGHAFELALAYLWRIENPGWRLSPAAVQLPSTSWGFPALVTLDRRASRGTYRRVVEFKTARSLEEWGDEFTDQAPWDYLAQVMAQMMFTGWTTHPAHLMVMGPFLRHHTYIINYDAQVANDIAQQCLDFYKSLARNTVPPIDDKKATYRAIKALHPLIEREKVVQVPADLIEEVRLWRGRKEFADAKEQLYKNRLLDAMGNAQRGRVGNVNVSLRKPHSKGGVALDVNKKEWTVEDLSMQAQLRGEQR